jgi:two-component system response regulator YesN
VVRRVLEQAQMPVLSLNLKKLRVYLPYKYPFQFLKKCYILLNMKLKFMLVDDEVIVLEGYKKLFDWEKRGFTIICEARDGISAVSLANQYRPDIILMDINIPILSGLDAIQKITEQIKDIGIIIVSGYDEFAYAQQAVRLQVADYILKPVKFEQLAVTLERIRMDLLKKRSGRPYLTAENKEGKRIYKIITYLSLFQNP